MNKNPYFSVIIPLFNKENYIEKTINSILNQTFMDFEILIIDDGSTDKSVDKVSKIKDARIKLIKQSNGGPSKARNKGIQKANGKFIAFLDADDEWIPQKLEKHYTFHMNNTSILWSYSGFIAIGGKRDEEFLSSSSKIYKDALDAIIFNIPPNTITVVINRIIFSDKRFLFNEKVKRSEDREVWLKIACIYSNIGYINEILSIYKINTEGSLCSTGLEDADLSFLTMAKRIEDITLLIEKKRKEKLSLYLNNYNVRQILTIWGWSDSFSLFNEELEKHLPPKLFKYLNFWNFLPLIIKKIVVKTFIKIKRKR